MNWKHKILYFIAKKTGKVKKVSLSEDEEKVVVDVPNIFSLDNALSLIQEEKVLLENIAQDKNGEDMNEKVVKIYNNLEKIEEIIKNANK